MENFLGSWWIPKQLGVNGGQKRSSEGKLTSVQQMKKKHSKHQMHSEVDVFWFDLFAPGSSAWNSWSGFRLFHVQVRGAGSKPEDEIEIEAL